MGCSISIQPDNRLPDSPTLKSESARFPSTASHTKPTPRENLTTGTYINIDTENIANGSQNALKDPFQRRKSFTWNQGETRNVMPELPREPIASKQEIGTLKKTETLTRGKSNENLEKKAKHLRKPSTFLREKIFSEEYGSIEGGADQHNSESTVAKTISEGNFAFQKLGQRSLAEDGQQRGRKSFGPIKPGEDSKKLTRPIQRIQEAKRSSIEGALKFPAFDERQTNPVETQTRKTKSKESSVKDLLKEVVKEEIEAEEGENEEKEKGKSGISWVSIGPATAREKEQKSNPEPGQQKIRKQIQRGFTMNLIDLYGSKKSTATASTMSSSNQSPTIKGILKSKDSEIPEFREPMVIREMQKENQEEVEKKKKEEEEREKQQKKAEEEERVKQQEKINEEERVKQQEKVNEEEKQKQQPQPQVQRKEEEKSGTNPRTKSFRIQRFLTTKTLDLSIEGNLEEQDFGGKQLRPSSPIKKTLFSSICEDLEENSSPEKDGKPLGITRQLSHNGGYFRVDSATPLEKKETTSPSMLFSERRTKFSEGSAGSIVIETKVLDKSIDDDGQKRVNQYVMSKELGRGSFGRVKLASDHESGKKFAIKIANKGKLKKKLLTRDKSVFTLLQGEIAVMKKLYHPNIVQLFEVIDDPNAEKLYLVMEYVQRGAVMSKQYWDTENQVTAPFFNRASTVSNVNLKMVLKGLTRRSTISPIREAEDAVIGSETRPLSEEKARKYFRDLVLGLDYMHHYAGVIHRDIKPENLLIDEDDTLKISDFNISCILEETNNKGLIKNAAGTKTFLAPEAWLGGQFRGQPVDIWAAGATLYYFLFGRPPFFAGKADKLKELVLESEPEFPSDTSVSEGAIDLIKACLKKNPDERISLEEIMLNNWLTEDGLKTLDNDGAQEVVVSETDINKAMTMRLKATFRLAIGLQKSLKSARKSLGTKKTLEFNGTEQMLDTSNL